LHPCWFALTDKKRQGDGPEAKMVELTSYGLTGLTAMLVMAFCFAYGDELPRTREKSSCGLINNAHVTDSPLVETGHGAIYTDRFRSDRGTLEAFHG
jgi:hypothetical protein